MLQNGAIASVVALVVVIVYTSQQDCASFPTLEGEDGASHDKMLESVDSVNSYLRSLEKQVAQLRQEIVVNKQAAAGGGGGGGGVVRGEQQQGDSSSSSDKPHKQQPKTKVVLFTLLFGEAAVNQPWLPLFVKSAAASHVDYIIVGDPVVPFELPSNVKQIHISYQDLVKKISTDLFDG
jgi:hypothetical protein